MSSPIRPELTNAEPIPLDAFTYQGKPLSLQPAADDEDADALKATAQIVDQLRQSRFANVHAIFETTKDVKRLFFPYEYRVQGKLTKAIPFFTPQYRAMALALYLFIPASSTYFPRCQQCSSSNHRGPCQSCVVPRTVHTKGACTNCYYSGTGNSCSLRQNKEEKEEKRRGQAQKEKFKGFTPEYLQHLTIEQLEEYKKWIEEAEDAARDDGSPVKRRRP